ncbi:uncharacterized protein LOC106161821 [Lingula anatina]|uniref:Uncharacterized protein LOC106161821 n=1 Tax=Lingula anatina TaxID=7574 RepID=A0A1S3I7R2_LINAN|nr:uncharacterized protein LOC106161821 [Lingula anatina]|eukprot:XP_013394305.1 uncharacterized protein LOC106161821 [Lingula anatina]
MGIYVRRTLILSLVAVYVAVTLGAGMYSYSYYNPGVNMQFYKYGPWYYRPNTCQKPETPCYNYVLTFISDGSANLTNLRGSRSNVLAHHRLAGRSEADAIEEGKRGAAWLKNKYGIDLTGIPDEAYLDGTKAVTIENGALTFSTLHLPRTAMYRLVTASRGETAEFCNVPISDSGWMIAVNEEFQASGTFNSILPKGARLFYGDYIVSLCDHVTGYGTHFRSPCFNVFRKAKLIIHFENKTYTSLGDVTVLDYDVKESSLGNGRARGVIFTEPNDKMTVRNVLTFSRL